MFLEQTVKAIRDLKADCDALDRQQQSFKESSEQNRIELEYIFREWKNKQQKIHDFVQNLGSELFLAVEDWDEEKLSDFFRQLED